MFQSKSGLSIFKSYQFFHVTICKCLYRRNMSQFDFIHDSGVMEKNNTNTCISSEYSDQPGHPNSLIRAFAVNLKKA